MNMRSRCLVAAAAFLLASPFAADAETMRIRAVLEWEGLRTELLDAAAAFPSAAGKLTEAVEVVEGGRMLVEDDLLDVVQVNGLATKGLGNYPPELVPAFDVLVASLGQFTNGTLEDFETEVDTYASANPDKPVTNQRKALAKARALVVKAGEVANAGAKADKLRKAILKIRKVKVFPYVKKPPKKCMLPKLDKGESSVGPWGLFDLTSQKVEPYYFEANWNRVIVTKDPQGVATRLQITFGYCNGQDQAAVSLDFDILNPAVDSFNLGNSVGALHRGAGGFGVNLTSNSYMTITFLDVVNGIVGGTYVFSATSGTAGGSGSFLMLIDPPQ